MKLLRCERQTRDEVNIPDGVFAAVQVPKWRLFDYVDAHAPYTFRVELETCAGCRGELPIGEVAWLYCDIEAIIPAAYHPVCGRRAHG